MKVLLVLDLFSPLGGGVSSVVFKLANELVSLGHSVTIFATDEKRDPEYEKQLNPGVKVKYFKSLFKIGGLSFAPGAFFYSAFSVKNFDVVHFHSFTSFINIPISFCARLFNVPTIIDCHGNLPSTDNSLRKKFFHQLFGMQMFKTAKYLVAETKLGADEYVAVGGDPKKLIIQHPGFDTSEYSVLPSPGKFREKFGIGAEKKIIFFLGRIHKIKGIDFLVKGYKLLSESRSDTVLVIAGPDDGHLSVLKDLISELNLSDKIIFAGFMNHKQKMEALVDTQVFVQPSRYEQGIAHTTIEALLCNVPVVATSKNGAAEDLKKMEAGFLVDFDDCEQLKDYLELVLNGDQKALENTKNGKEHILAQLDLKKTVQKFEEIYRNVAI